MSFTEVHFGEVSVSNRTLPSLFYVFLSYYINTWDSVSASWSDLFVNYSTVTTGHYKTRRHMYFLQVTLMDIIFADINPKLYLLFLVSKHCYFCSSLKVSVEIHILRTISVGAPLRSVHKPFTFTAVDRRELIRMSDV